jgi:hypothetical protein
MTEPSPIVANLCGRVKSTDLNHRDTELFGLVGQNLLERAEGDIGNLPG